MSRRLELAALCLILALGAFLRFRRGGEVPFGEDAAHMLELSDRLWQGELVLAGIPSSKGVLNPPLAIYLLAALRPIARSPRALAVVTECGGLLAVLLAWVAARRFCGREVALVAAALFAVSGWAVFYSRALWQQDFLPPLGSAFLLCLLYWAVERRGWALAAALFLASAASQLHLTGFAWFLVIAAVAAVVRAPLPARPLALGLSTGALLYLPFLGEWIRRGSLATVPGAPRPHALFTDFSGRPILFALASATHGGIGFQYRLLGARLLSILPAPERFLFGAVPWLEGGLVALGLIICWRVRRTAPVFAVLALAASIPVAAMLLSGLSTSPHYLILLFPLPWILAGVAVRALLLDRVGRIIALIAPLALGEALFVLKTEDWVAEDPVHAADEAPPLARQEEAIRWVIADAAGQPVRLLGSPAGDPAPDQYRWLLRNEGGREGGGRQYLLLFEGAGLTEQARALLLSRGGQSFGGLIVAPWPAGTTASP